MSDLELVATEQAPRAIGPYSQGVIANGLLFTAGQIAPDPATMDVVPGGVKEQTERVMANPDAILRVAGTSLSRVVKTTCFLVDMRDFAAFSEVYSRWFGDHKPARSTVAASGLPKGVLVEVEAVAAAD